MTVLHVDMDAFFASVEQRDHPEWRGKPVIVGAPPDKRGVVSTCSYEARRYGVHSAMPSRTAYARCPQGIFVRPRMAAYEEASARAFEAFARHSPFVEQVSIDEAFLDVTGTVHLFGSAAALGQHLRADVRESCGLTCSVGIGPNRLLAKIGSEEAKPDGLYEMPTDPVEIRDWLAPRPATILWGVGKKTAEILARCGLKTCGDVRNADPRFLVQMLGPAAAASIAAHARGEDASVVAREDPDEKSVSRESTFIVDESDRAAVRARLLALADDVGRRCRRVNRWACTAKVKLRDAAFETRGRQMHLVHPARDDVAFRHAASTLFDVLWPRTEGRTVRLVGFGVSDFADTPNDEQPTLFADLEDEKRRKHERISETLDSVKGVRWGSATYAKSQVER